MNYDTQDCITYIESKVSTLISRADEFTTVFTVEELNKEIEMMEATLERLRAIMALQTIDNMPEKEAAIDILTNS